MISSISGSPSLFCCFCCWLSSPLKKALTSRASSVLSETCCGILKISESNNFCMGGRASGSFLRHKSTNSTNPLDQSESASLGASFSWINTITLSTACPWWGGLSSAISIDVIPTAQTSTLQS
eukprot:Lithocolla_globosa_v1_NODE_3960_length_1543_cov_3.678763.p2 type:complete len:123 gc:universal NODE_3960_length_1543_cov_3.678763:840-1208(+)